MLRPLAGLLAGLSVAQAASVSSVNVLGAGMPSANVSTISVLVESGPGLTFNRQVPGVLTLTTPWGTQAARLNSGTLYAPDPQHYWASLNPLRLRPSVPAGTAAGHYPVSVKTVLYVCDQNIHLCTVRSSETQGLLGVGLQTAPLTLILKVRKLKSF